MNGSGAAHLEVSAARLVCQAINQFTGGIVDEAAHLLELGGEVVEEPNGDDSHAETDGGGQERFGDTSRNGGETAATGTGVRHQLERGDDTKHRTEQPHER